MGSAVPRITTLPPIHFWIPLGVRLSLTNTYYSALKRFIIEAADISGLAGFKSVEGIRDIIIRRKSRSYELDLKSREMSTVLNQLPKIQDLISVHVYEEGPKANYPLILDSQELSRLLTRGISLMSEERYWEAHVALEPVWVSSTGEVKKAFWCLIHICASMVKQQMGQQEEAMVMYERAFKVMQTISILDDVSLPGNFVYPIFIEFPAKLAKTFHKEI